MAINLKMNRKNLFKHNLKINARENLLEHNLKVNALELYIYEDLFTARNLITKYLKDNFAFELQRVDFIEMWDGNPILVKSKTNLNSELINTMFAVAQGLSAWSEQIHFDLNKNCWKINNMCQLLKNEKLNEIVKRFYEYKKYIDNCSIDELKKINMTKE